MSEARDRLVRLLVEEGEQDAERDIRWYSERIRSAIRDGIEHREWVQLRNEAKAVARFCRQTLAAAERMAPDPIDLAKETAEIAAMAPGEVMEVYGK